MRALCGILLAALAGPGLGCLGAGGGVSSSETPRGRWTVVRGHGAQVGAKVSATPGASKKPVKPHGGKPWKPQADSRAVPLPANPFKGLATWYGRGFHGKRTASGERYNMHALTAAHRTLPFGTEVRVTNLRNKREVVVRIIDRGPFGPGRVIDLSMAAAKRLDMLRAGVVSVELRVLSWGKNCRTFHGRTTCRPSEHFPGSAGSD